MTNTCIQDFRCVYLTPLSCLLNSPALAHYGCHLCLARLFEASFLLAQWSPLHQQSLPCICNRSPPPVMASLHLRSLPSTCDRSPSPAIAPLYLRSLPSTSDSFPSPAIASLPVHLRSFPSTSDCFLHLRSSEGSPPSLPESTSGCDRFSPPAINFIHLRSLSSTSNRSLSPVIRVAATIRVDLDSSLHCLPAVNPLIAQLHLPCCLALDRKTRGPHNYNCWGKKL
jgi:hypothetical protein